VSTTVAAVLTTVMFTTVVLATVVPVSATVLRGKGTAEALINYFSVYAPLEIVSAAPEPLVCWIQYFHGLLERDSHSGIGTAVVFLEKEEPVLDRCPDSVLVERSEAVWISEEVGRLDDSGELFVASLGGYLENTPRPPLFVTGIPSVVSWIAQNCESPCSKDDVGSEYYESVLILVQLVIEKSKCTYHVSLVKARGAVAPVMLLQELQNCANVPFLLEVPLSISTTGEFPAELFPVPLSAIV